MAFNQRSDPFYTDLVMRTGENLFAAVVTANGQFVDATLTSVGLLSRHDGLPARMMTTLYPFATDLIKSGSLADAAPSHGCLTLYFWQHRKTGGLPCTRHSRMKLPMAVKPPG
jgi:hypothetical protein